MSDKIDFIVCGPLRGGTTMLRLMINNHPRLANVGEFDFLFTHSHAGPDGTRRIDRHRLRHGRGFQIQGLVMDDALDDAAQMADFFKQIAARKPGIHSINIHHKIDEVLDVMPGVKVVKLHRDPRDVARSSIPMGFAGTLYEAVGHWIETEQAWDRARAKLAPEDYMEVRFEELVADPQRELSRICAFFGVAYDPRMLNYSEDSNYHPPDASIAFKWKRSMRPADAALITSRAPELVASRGYEVPPGTRAPGTLRLLGLKIADRVGVWRHQLRRFGVATVLVEKVSRRLGLRRLHGEVLDKRINPTIMSQLK